MTRVVLLGPQEKRPTAGQTLASLGMKGRIGTITAGWQEWEAEDEHLDKQLGGKSLNLRLYARAERVWVADPKLRAGHRDMQDRLRELRRLYNKRLRHLAESWMELLLEPGPDGLLEPERTAALEAIRSLDAHHLARIAAERAEFENEWKPLERAAVKAERKEIAAALADCEAVVIEGGHVALLHNRMRIFSVEEMLSDRLVVGCSGGAMVLGERVALFHDSPPSGPGHTEVALTGLGLFSGLVPLPHARERLRLDDPGRVARMAARFAPDRCVVLEPGTRLDWDGSTWTPVEVDHLRPDGSVRRWEAAA